ncbi:glycosyl transferase [bacterium (candidate division B38) B3_B38]|nr:MAG: glycosyl transferase [bacterium (candidate division B38) B3_B38]
MRIALVHDWLTGMRGGERVLEVLCEIYPQATIFTLLHIPGATSPIIERMTIKTSFIQRLPFASTRYRHYLPLFPTAIEQFDLRGYDLIISISHCVAKGAIVPSDAIHICYCNTPMRYAWDLYHDYFSPQRLGFLRRKLIPLFINYLRMWDVTSSARVDYFIANSNNVASRIMRHYKRESMVIYPPVDTEFFVPGGEPKEFFLIVSALVPYKKIDLAIETLNQLKLSLKIVGKGPELSRLKRMANRNITFLGELSNEEIRSLYQSCQALIFPGVEDFGLTSLEAQACGRPVIAFRKGGALESVIEEQTGVFFNQQASASLKNAIDKFYKMSFNKKKIRANALRFSREKFKQRVIDFISDSLGNLRRDSKTDA